MIQRTLDPHHDCYLLFAVEGASNVGEKPGTIQAVVGEVAKIPCELTPGRAKATQAFYFAHIFRLPYSALEKRTEYSALNLLLVSLLWVYWNGSHHTHLNHWYLFTACWYLGVPRTCQSAVADWYWSFAVHQWIVRDITFQSAQNKWVDDQDSAYLVLWYKDIFGTPIYR